MKEPKEPVDEVLFEEMRDGFRIAGELAKETTRALTLINGGAVLGLLTFVGNLKKDSLLRIDLEKVGTGLILFSLALGFAVLACLLAWMFYGARADLLRMVYLARPDEPSLRGRWAATMADSFMIVAAIFSLGMFFIGTISTFNGFNLLPVKP